MHRRILVGSVLALAVTGCADMQKKEKVSRLDVAVAAYAAAIRWGNFDAAAAFAKPRSGEKVIVDLSRLNVVKVTGYSVRVNRVDENGLEADVAFSFTYYLEDRGTVHTVNQSAVWYLNETIEQWQMDGVLPEFKV